MRKFYSIFKNDINNFLAMRRTVLGDSAFNHDISYLKCFDAFLSNIGLQEREISESVFNEWLKTLTGKIRSKAEKIIIIRIFIKYLHSLGISAYTPIIPKVADDYIPYIFCDEELDKIFNSADNIIVTSNLWFADSQTRI